MKSALTFQICLKCLKMQKNWKPFLTPFGPLCTLRKNIFNLIALNLGDHFRIQVRCVSYLKKVSVPGFVPLTFQSEVRSLIHYTTKSWLQMWVCLVYYKGIFSTVVFFPSKDGCCYGGIGRGASGGVSRGGSRGIGIG